MGRQALAAVNLLALHRFGGQRRVSNMDSIRFMKTIIFILLTIFAPFVSVTAADTNSMKVASILVFTNNTDSAGSAETNLVSFFPAVQLLNINEMLKTNGVECWLEFPGGSFIEKNSNAIPSKALLIPVCFVTVFNHSTDFIGCLRMPATNLCRIVLLDKQGDRVKKTPLGMTYGLPLSEEQIDWWFNHWNTTHQSILIRIIPNGILKYFNADTEICRFSLKDAFDIKEPGEYELHLQLRLIQVGIDSSGKLHYPVTWLPEVAIKVHITQEDLH